MDRLGYFARGRAMRNWLEETKIGKIENIFIQYNDITQQHDAEVLTLEGGIRLNNAVRTAKHLEDLIEVGDLVKFTTPAIDDRECKEILSVQDGVEHFVRQAKIGQVKIKAIVPHENLKWQNVDGIEEVNHG